VKCHGSLSTTGGGSARRVEARAERALDEPPATNTEDTPSEDPPLDERPTELRSRRYARQTVRSTEGIVPSEKERHGGDPASAVCASVGSSGAVSDCWSAVIGARRRPQWCRAETVLRGWPPSHERWRRWPTASHCDRGERWQWSPFAGGTLERSHGPAGANHVCLSRRQACPSPRTFWVDGGGAAVLCGGWVWRPTTSFR